MRKIIVITIILGLFLSGCATTSSDLTSPKQPSFKNIIVSTSDLRREYEVLGTVKASTMNMPFVGSRDYLNNLLRKEAYKQYKDVDAVINVRYSTMAFAEGILDLKTGSEAKGIAVRFVNKEENSKSKIIAAKERPVDSEEKQTIGGAWTRYSQNPVIKGDLSHSWMQLIGDPSVLKDGSVYRIWFGANILDGITQIGYAISPDGINWNVHPQPVMKAGPAGSWDSLNTETPAVIKKSDGTYEMWYSGTRAEPGEPVTWDMLHKIGHATSPDGIVWTKDPTPVLDMTRDSTPVWRLNSNDLKIWNVLGVADPTVLKEGDTYKMWHTGAALKDGKMIQQIGYATSKDGKKWEEYKQNPVLPLGKPGSWDSFSVAQPSVFHDGKRYIMLYTGTDKEFGDESSGNIGVAFSEDGVNWERSDKPVLKKGKSADRWDGRGIWGSAGIMDGNAIKIWYTGIRATTHDLSTGIGCATAKGLDKVEIKVNF